MTLYQELVANKVEGISNHESDLYFPVNNLTTAILLKYPEHFKNATRFRDNLNHQRLSYDVPFAYDLWWQNRPKATHLSV